MEVIDTCYRQSILNNPDLYKNNAAFFRENDYHLFLVYIYGVLENREEAYNEFLSIKDNVVNDDKFDSDTFDTLKQAFEYFMDEIFLMFNDIVSAFCWYYNKTNRSSSEFEETFAKTLYIFKQHNNLKLIYNNILEYLKKEYKLLLNTTDVEKTNCIEGAILIILVRLNRYNEAVSLIENSKNDNLYKESLWFRLKLRVALTKDYDVDIAFKRWLKLANKYEHNTKSLESTLGRLWFPMSFFIKYKNNEEIVEYYSAILNSLMVINNHISDIKEILTCDLQSPVFSHYIPHITMYMSPNKFERVFFNNQSENPNIQLTWKLTCADHMNDDLEGKVLYSFFKECGINIFDNITGNYGIQLGENRSSVYLGSFSGTINDEYMYDLYATGVNSQKGVCLELDIDSFDNLIEDELVNDEYYWMCPLYYVVYANSLSDIDNEIIIKRIKGISKLINGSLLFWQDFSPETKVLKDEFFTTIFKMLEEIAYLFKTKDGIDDKNVTRSWKREKELRLMKCVRGYSDNILEYNATDSNGRNYRNYITRKQIKIKNIYGGNDNNDLKIYKDRISNLYQQLNIDQKLDS